MNNEELVPTRATEFENADTDTVRLTSGRVFGIQAVNPLYLWDLGVLNLPDPDAVRRAQQMTQEQLESATTDDDRMKIYEIAKLFIAHGVTSVMIITDPHAKPDASKNEVSIYKLSKTEWLELAAHIDKLSGFGVLSSGGDDTFRPDASNQVGASGDERSVAEQSQADRGDG
jgi:hypothetical protein